MRLSGAFESFESLLLTGQLCLSKVVQPPACVVLPTLVLA
jgi:hypothetical protein